MAHRHTPEDEGVHVLAFEAYGVAIAIEVADPALLPRVEGILPPGSRVREPKADDFRFRIFTTPGGMYAFEAGSTIPGSVELDVALAILDTQIRQRVAFLADQIFVHAGVVASGGKAIVIPGASFSGKTTLVRELVRAGAQYYSDEYAVLDEQGLVHPYAKPLSLRPDGGWTQTDTHVHDLGGTSGDDPLPVGLVVVTQYRPNTVWEPHQLSSGEAVLALLANTVPARDRPEQALAFIRRAVEAASVFEGDRGDAAEIVPRVLELAAE